MSDGAALAHDSAALSNDGAAAGDAPGSPPRWQKWLSIGGSLAMAALLLHQTAAIGWRSIAAMLPADPLFYLLFTAMYLALPAAELAIFRRHWPIGPAAIWLFLRKRVLNEAVFGYSGEAYLYLWAKRQPGLRRDALGIVKDISITSALAATLLTLVTLGGVLLYRHSLAADGLFGARDLARLGWGAVLLCLPALAVLLFSKRLMTLPRRENATIFALHLARLLLTTGLLVAAWHVALPGVAWRVWAVLAALRLALGRLPFAPNPDLLFSGIAVALAGPGHGDIAAVLALCAALTLALHGLVVAADWARRAALFNSMEPA